MDAEGKLNALYEAVVKMRDYQIKSEKYRCSDDRAKYLYHQRKVDDLLRAEAKERKSLQKNLF